MKFLNARLANYSPTTIYAAGLGDAVILAVVIYTIYRVFGN